MKTKKRTWEEKLQKNLNIKIKDEKTYTDLDINIIKKAIKIKITKTKLSKSEWIALQSKQKFKLYPTTYPISKTIYIRNYIKNK
jgi:hypothetical protein